MKITTEKTIDVYGYDPDNPQPLTGERPRRPPPSPELCNSHTQYVSLPLINDFEGFQLRKGMIQLESDIYEWLQGKGQDFESRANAILRRAMILEKGL